MAAEKFYYLIYFFSYVFCFTDMILKGKYDVVTIIIATVTIVICYLATYFLYKKISKKKINTKIKFKINYKMMHIFMSAFIVVMTFLNLRSGARTAASLVTTSGSIFESLFVVSGVFPFYYCIVRKENKIAVRFNAILYILSQLTLGYVGSIFLIGIFELFFLWEEKKINILKMAGVAVGAFTFGGVAYSFFYPLKFAIRYGTAFDFSLMLSLVDGIVKLSERFSHLNTTVYSMKNMDYLVTRYQMQHIDLLEFKAAFRPLIPSALFINKSFSSIGNIVHNAMTGYTNTNGTDSPSILTYYKILYKSDFVSFLGCILLFIIFLRLIKYFCSCFECDFKNFRPLFFWLLVNGYTICGNLESLFSDTYLKFIFVIPVWWLFGVVRVYYKKQNNYRTE